MIDRGICFPSEMFIDPIDTEDLVCLICYGIIRKPVRDRCKHVYNYECLRRWLRDSNRCPLSKLEIKVDELLSLTPLAQIQPSIKTRCAYFEDCHWSGQFGELERHLEFDCQFERIFCFHVGCYYESAPRIYMNEHLKNCFKRPMQCLDCCEIFTLMKVDRHIDSCRKRLTECPNGCSTIIRADDAFHTKECPFANSLCIFHHIGCSFRGNRFELKDHYDHRLCRRDHLMLLLLEFTENMEKSKSIIHDIAQNLDQISTQIEVTRKGKEADALNIIQRADTKIVLIASLPVENGSKYNQPKVKSVRANLKIRDQFIRFKIQNCFKVIEGWGNAYRNRVRTDLARINNFATRVQRIFIKAEKEKQIRIVAKGDKFQDNFKSTDHLSNEKEFALETPHIIGLDRTNFSKIFSLGNILIDSSTNTVSRIIAGHFLLLTRSVEPFQIYKFFIADADVSKVAVGLCRKSKVQKMGYLAPQCLPEGPYLFFGNGAILECDKFKLHKGTKEPLIFTCNQKIILYLDMARNELVCSIPGTTLVSSMPFFCKDLHDFYPCVYSETTSKFYLKRKRVNKQATSLPKFTFGLRSKSCGFAISKAGEAVFSKEQAIGVLEWRMMSCEPFRFEIVKQKSDFMSVGIFTKYFPSSNFDSDFIQKCTLLMFAANGDVETVIEESTPMSYFKGIAFKTGDIVDLSYNSNESALIFSNLISGQSVRFEFLREDWGSSLFAFVKLVEIGECVRLLPRTPLIDSLSFKNKIL